MKRGPVRGERRSLAQFGGRVETRGEPRLAELLTRAWREAEREPARRESLTHGFHAYPARAHPLLVRFLVRELSRPGDLVVDPFCGSGTMLVEAVVANRRAFGCDVNGVAIRLARLKARRTTAAFRAGLRRAAGRIAARGHAAAHGGDASEPLAPELRGAFAPHVAHELDALGRALDRERDAELHGALLLVLSSLLTKVSRRESETSERERERPLAPGFASHLFAERAEEVAQGLAALAGAAPCVVALADARALPLRAQCAALVVTSPPYLGTYDYGRIQALRARLLGIPLAAAERREIGARRPAAAPPAPAIEAFGAEIEASLREVARVLTATGIAVVIVGDSRAGAHPLQSDRLVEEAANAAGLRVIAVASQERTDRGGAGPAPYEGGRREHLVALAPERVHAPFRSR